MKIAVIGGGSWGTALSKVFAEKGHQVSILVRRKEVALAINQKKTNPFYLPEITLPSNLKASLYPEEVFLNAEVVVWAIPSFALKEVLNQIKDFVEKVDFHLSCIKGIDFQSKKTPLTILKEFLSKKEIFVLGGPSFAKEVAQGLPTAVVLAGEKEDLTQKLQEEIAYSYFRVYRSDDPKGVELAGALKNVIAIASGISDGLGLGLNARASLITRGLVEIVRLGTKLGGKLATFYGLAGIGDLLLTCTGALSRNYKVGYALGKGENLSQILKNLHQVAEGVKTCLVVKELAEKYNVELPISFAVYDILYKNEEPKKCLKNLLSRALKKEFEDPFFVSIS